LKNSEITSSFYVLPQFVSQAPFTIIKKMAPPHYCADLHNLQDNCVINVFEIFFDGFKEGVRMYSPIFIIPSLFFGKRGYVQPIDSFIDRHKFFESNHFLINEFFLIVTQNQTTVHSNPYRNSSFVCLLGYFRFFLCRISLLIPSSHSQILQTGIAYGRFPRWMDIYRDRVLCFIFSKLTIKKEKEQEIRVGTLLHESSCRNRVQIA
jgi:hypothetical protein